MLTMVLRISGVLGVLGVCRELSPAELAGTFSEQFNRIFLALCSLLLIVESCGDYLL